MEKILVPSERKLQMVTWSASLAIGLFFTVVVALMCRHGADISDSDTLSYLRFSQTNRLADLPIHHGVGYAIFLKICSLFFKSYNPMTALGNMVCGFLFSSLLARWFLRAFGREGLLGTCAVLANSAILEVYARAMSEGLFLLALVLGAMGLSKWWSTRNFIWILISGLATGVACLTRYAGVPFACCFALCLWRGESVGKRGVCLSAVHLGISLVGLFSVLLTHHLFAGTATNRLLRVHWAGSFQLGMGSTTLVSWLMPDRVWLAIPSLPFIVSAMILLFCTVGLVHGWKHGNCQRMLWSVSILAYLQFLFISYSLFDSDIHFYHRMLSPIVPFLFFGLVDAFSEGTPKFRWVGWIVFSVWIALGIQRACPMVFRRFREGSGWGSLAWTQSATIRAVELLPKSIKVYSNASGLFAWRGISNVEGIVFFQRPATEMEAPGFVEAYGRMLDELRDGRACLVNFPACVWMKRTVPFERIVTDAGLEKLAEYEDGSVWGQPGMLE